MKTKTILLLALLCGCPSDAPTEAGSASGSTTVVTETDPSAADGSSTTEDTAGPSTTASDTEPDDTITEGDGSSSGDGPDPLPPLPCPDEFNCQADRDLDGFPLGCDNAYDHTNPDQSDMDFDSIGDVIDLCPTVQGINNLADSDRDGVGNECDRCPRLAVAYSGQGNGGLSERFAFRSLPDQADSDGDGIGDACDNCVQQPNCLGYGESRQHELGIELDIEDPDCQSDLDGDYIGDACEGQQEPGAAGPVGMGMNDDFDQDGLANGDDACVRLPVDLGTCSGSNDCPSGSSCTDGVCGHIDTDDDGLGDRCDNCPFTPNPDQADSDIDWIGDACEANSECIERTDPRPFGFFDRSAGGWCCTTAYDGQPLTDPDGAPLPVQDLPATLGVGVLELPPGCDGEGQAMTLDDVGSDEELWEYLCILPQWDQDLDAIGDSCDLCPFAFDPTNAPYVDDNGMLWPTDGLFCNGEYHCSNQE